MAAGVPHEPRRMACENLEKLELSSLATNRSISYPLRPAATAPHATRLVRLTTARNPHQHPPRN